MKRREFFKDAGIFTCGCAFMAGCIGSTVKIKENIPPLFNDWMSTLDREAKPGGSDWLPHIEFSLAYHCNLNCACCCHCSPIAPVSFMPLDIFEKDLDRIQKITQGKVRHIILLGGEPLLNKNVEEYLKLTRKYFNNSVIILLTNGLLLNDMPDSFWRTCCSSNTIIHHAFYPLYEKYPDLAPSYEKSTKYNVKIKSAGKPRYKFYQMLLSNKNTNDVEKRYKSCINKIKCAVIDNGIFYPCHVIFSANTFLNKKFKEFALPVTEKDYVDIYKIKSLEKILEFLKKPKDFCKYCHYSPKTKKLWTLSKGEAAEWFDV